MTQDGTRVLRGDGHDSTSNSLYVVNLDSLCDGHFSASRAKREALFSAELRIKQNGARNTLIEIGRYGGMLVIIDEWIVPIYLSLLDTIN